jgi:uncharacterized protein YlxW (UPF0749 family)
MQQKNATLTESLARAKEELRSAERDRVSLEDEKRRLQTQLNNVQRQTASTEASLEAANQVQVFSRPFGFSLLTNLLCFMAFDSG